MSKKTIIPIIIAALAAVFASQSPDGLDKVSEVLGFSDKAIEHSAIMTGYQIPFIGNSSVSAIFAGLIGVLITYGIFLLIGKYLQFRQAK
jgi:lipopolysaccharide export LptBFGC system permease protein LptF